MTGFKSVVFDIDDWRVSIPRFSADYVFNKRVTRFSFDAYSSATEYPFRICSAFPFRVCDDF